MAANDIINVHLFGHEIGRLGLDENTGRSSFQYNPEFLNSIILGARASAKLENEIRDAVDNFNDKYSTTVKIYQMKLSDAYYDLHIPEHPVY